MSIVPSDPNKRAGPELPPARVRIRKRPAPDRCASDQALSAEDSPQTDNEYRVGYKRPPRHTQFKPGRSGNPRGRPKAAKGLHSLVRETLTQKVAVRTSTGTRKISRIEAVLHKTVEQAMKGNPRALAELLKLYGNAVPNETNHIIPENGQADLTATDLATLEELRVLLNSTGEEQP